MILQTGDKLLIVHRRLFEKDAARFFVGGVEEYEAGIARVTGHSFVRDTFGNGVFRKEDPRTKLFAIASGTLLVYRLPNSVDLRSLHFIVDDSHLRLTDAGTFVMDLSEWGHSSQYRVG